GWGEAPLTLDLARAKEVSRPAGARRAKGPLDPDDLEGLWAEAEAARFAVLEVSTGAGGFYGCARTASARKYGVRVPVLATPPVEYAGADPRRLFELTTGTTAVREALQLRRLLPAESRDRGERTVPIGKVPGIELPEQPWEKLL